MAQTGAAMLQWQARRQLLTAMVNVPRRDIARKWGAVSGGLL